MAQEKKGSEILFNVIHVETATGLLFSLEWMIWIYYLHALIQESSDSEYYDFNLLLGIIMVYGIVLLIASVGFLKKLPALFQLILFLQFVRLWSCVGVSLSTLPTVHKSVIGGILFYLYYIFILIFFYCGGLYISVKYFRYLKNRNAVLESPFVKIDMFNQNMCDSPDRLEVKRCAEVSLFSINELFEYRGEVALV